jgi:type VI secretion system protein ImpE
MTPTDLFRAGNLRAATDAQLAEVKAFPGDGGRRLFLFELAAFAGDWGRARRQLDALPPADSPGAAAAVELYHGCLDAAEARERVFRSAGRPAFFENPPEHLTLRAEAVERLRGGHADDAAGLLARADEAASPSAGMFNGSPFQQLRDADDRFGPVVEVFARGKYLWVAVEQIDAVVCNPPKSPRDLLWLPAKLMARSGETGDVFLPATYPGSAGHADEEVQLGRTTDWGDGPGPVVGAGGRLWLVDDAARPLLDLRQLEVAAGEG